MIHKRKQQRVESSREKSILLLSDYSINNQRNAKLYAELSVIVHMSTWLFECCLKVFHRHQFIYTALLLFDLSHTESHLTPLPHFALPSHQLFCSHHSLYLKSLLFTLISPPCSLELYSPGFSFCFLDNPIMLLSLCFTVSSSYTSSSSFYLL